MRMRMRWRRGRRRIAFIVLPGRTVVQVFKKLKKLKVKKTELWVREG